MKLDRRTVLAGTAAAFAAPSLPSVPALRRRQAPVAGRFQSLESARKILSGKDYPDAAKIHDRRPRRADRARAGAGRPDLRPGRRPRHPDGAQRAQRLEPARLLRHGLGQRRPADRRQGLARSCSSSRPRRACRRSSTTSSSSAPRRASTWWWSASAVEGASTTAGGADIIAFASSQGLFAGASLEGSLPRSRQRLERALLRHGRHREGDRARPPLHQSRRRADPPVHGQVVRRL